MSDSEYKKIAVLIAKLVSDEITKAELETLEAWRNKNSENGLLYTKLLSSRRYITWVNARNSFDAEDAWSEVFPGIKKKSRIIHLKKVARIAAIFLLPLIFGGVTYFYFNNLIVNKKINEQRYAEIKPGSSKATLTLGDGRSIILDSAAVVSLTEVDGTQIEKDQKELHYEKQERTNSKHQVFNTINVPRGGEYKLTLADGTRVYLNSMTVLKYPVQFSSDKREVELIGEAYFEVKKNAEKPFVVKTKEMEVTVLGTSFNVNAYEESKNSVTTLVEGKVKLTHPLTGDERILSPNQQAVMDNLSGDFLLKEVDVSLFTSWKDGQLIFYDMSLEDIMILLTRWYSAKVFYQNPEVKNLRFSGSLDKYDDIDKFLDIIEATQKVNVRVSDNTILFAAK